MRSPSTKANKSKAKILYFVGVLSGDCGSVKGLSGSCGVSTNAPVWLIALLSGGGFQPKKWIKTISITVHCTFVSVLIFHSTVYLHKPIKDLNVTAYCLLSPFIVEWITAPIQTGFTFKKTPTDEGWNNELTKTWLGIESRTQTVVSTN